MTPAPRHRHPADDALLRALATLLATTGRVYVNDQDELADFLTYVGARYDGLVINLRATAYGGWRVDLEEGGTDR